MKKILQNEMIEIILKPLFDYAQQEIEQCEYVGNWDVSVGHRDDDKEINGHILIRMAVKWKPEKTLRTIEKFGDLIYDQDSLKWVDKE